MDKVIRIGEPRHLSGQGLLTREQIAAQIVAVMQAHFSRPGPEEMQQILRCAEGQITALALSPSPR